MTKKLSFKNVCPENMGPFIFRDLIEEVRAIIESFYTNINSENPDLKELCLLIDVVDRLAHEWNKLELINPDLHCGLWSEDPTGMPIFESECDEASAVFNEELVLMKHHLNDCVSKS